MKCGPIQCCVLFLLSFLALASSTYANLNPFTNSKSIRVFWWNVQHGYTNERLGSDPLGENLQSLANSTNSPDVIALGEFTYKAFSKKTLQTLRSQYREFYVPYNEETPEVGIAIFTKGQVEEIVIQPLEWGTPEFRKEWGKDFFPTYYFKKPYIRIAVTIAGQTYSVVPVHIAQPWMKIKKNFGRVLGKPAVVMSLLYGKNNPLAYQMRELGKAMQKDLENENQNIKTSHLVLIGDFNAPRAIGPQSTYSYRYLRDLGLLHAFEKTQATFPTVSSGDYSKFPGLQIDHAFVSPNLSVLSGGMLPFKGSDHYPIYVRATKRQFASEFPRIHCKAALSF